MASICQVIRFRRAGLAPAVSRLIKQISPKFGRICFDLWGNAFCFRCRTNPLSTNFIKGADLTYFDEYDRIKLS